MPERLFNGSLTGTVKKLPNNRSTGGARLDPDISRGRQKMQLRRQEIANRSRG
jgi:hypothetical protein